MGTGKVRGPGRAVIEWERRSHGFVVKTEHRHWHIDVPSWYYRDWPQCETREHGPFATREDAATVIGLLSKIPSTESARIEELFRDVPVEKPDPEPEESP
jgi:hypothetical protein